MLRPPRRGALDVRWLVGAAEPRKQAAPVTRLEASKVGGASMAREADAFASNVLPVIESIRAAGKASLRAIAEELNARRVETAQFLLAWIGTTNENPSCLDGTDPPDRTNCSCRVLLGAGYAAALCIDQAASLLDQERSGPLR